MPDRIFQISKFTNGAATDTVALVLGPLYYHDRAEYKDPKKGYFTSERVYQQVYSEQIS